MTEEAKKWTWWPDGVAFSSALSATFKTFTREELDQWLYAMERANSIYEILESAKVRFETGQVDYAGACVRLRKLLDEHEKAARGIHGAARSLVVFFNDIPGLREAFAQLTPKELDAFAREALPLLLARLEKPAEAAPGAPAADVPKVEMKLEP